MTSHSMTTLSSTSSSSSSVSFAHVAAKPADVHAHPVHKIPTGSWTAYFHEPDDERWTADSYKFLQAVESWEALGALLREIGPFRTTNGLLRIMRRDTSPLWEHRANIRGGTYCLKVTQRNACEIFNRYLAAAALGQCSKNPANEIVGVTISPKKGFCIIKVWNLDSTTYNSPSDIVLLHDEVREELVIYREHTNQRM